MFFVHLVNLTSNALGDGGISRRLRRELLKLLGSHFGDRTFIKGGGYIYGSGLTTGSQCFINRNCYFDLSGPIILGNNVVIGHGVTFITAEHQIGDATRRAGPAIGRKIMIQDGAWVGANVTILPGITIHKGSIIAAGAVVTKDVPPHVIVAGTPARVIRELELGKGEERPEVPRTKLQVADQAYP
jgi:maltose O-acetyltransferase